MPSSRFVVIESTPGYMPEDDEPFVGLWEEAHNHALELGAQLEEQGYSCNYSDANGAGIGVEFSIRCERSDTVAPDLGRTIEVVEADDLDPPAEEKRAATRTFELTPEQHTSAIAGLTLAAHHYGDPSVILDTLEVFAGKGAADYVRKTIESEKRKAEEAS